MKTDPKRILVAAVAVAALFAAPAFAAKDKKTNADTMMTVYVSGHGGSSIAKKMNESHMKMEAAGWRFSDFEMHTENGDTEGVLITYVK